MRRKLIDVGFPSKVDFLIQGGARGADLMSKVVAIELGFPKERIIQIDADWKTYGRAAGPIRNRQQNKAQPDLVLAFHDDFENSIGTKDMVAISEASGRVVWRSWLDPEYAPEDPRKCGG